MTEHSDGHGASAHLAQPRYTIRTKFFRIFGGAYHIYGPQGELLLYSHMKRFRLKEDIRLHSDPSRSKELLRITTRSIFDIAGAYDVQDSIIGERVGTLKREPISSTFLRDHWTIHDAAGTQVGEVVEDSMAKALVRRFFDLASFLLPQRYHAEIGGRRAGVFKQRFNPIIFKLDVDLTADPEAALDRRLAVAMGVLLSAIEGRQ
ncbi:MAG: hypothetical protein ACODAC_00585 [Pseudomonadota bacterium]